MMFDNVAELGEFVDKVFESLGGSQSAYHTLFQKIIGGCHCVPPTEWFGDIYLTFKKLLKDKAIKDKVLKKQAEEIALHLKTYFNTHL